MLSNDDQVRSNNFRNVTKNKNLKNTKYKIPYCFPFKRNIIFRDILVKYVAFYGVFFIISDEITI